MTSEDLKIRLIALFGHSAVRWTTAGAIVVAGVALTAARLAPLPDADRPTDGPLVRIALVAPTEPDIEPGAGMDVGDLTTGFDRAALARAEASRGAFDSASYDDDNPDYYDDDAMDADYDAPPPAYGRQAVITLPVVAPPPTDPRRDPRVEGRPYRFGFDAPRPDYAAERRARIARREAEWVERRRMAEEREYYARAPQPPYPMYGR